MPNRMTPITKPASPRIERDGSLGFVLGQASYDTRPLDGPSP